jgi:hypothetical protein
MSLMILQYHTMLSAASGGGFTGRSFCVINLAEDVVGRFKGGRDKADDGTFKSY